MAKKLKPLVLSPKEKAYIEATAYGETRHVPQSKKGLVFSPDGARGRLQIMPETYKEMMGSMEGWDNPKKLEEAGKRFAVKQFRDFKGDVRKAAGAYVRGPTAERESRPKGPRTKKYIPEVVGEYKRLMANVSDSSTKSKGKTTMDLKKKSLKGIQAEKEGKATLADKRRLKTWKAYKAGSQKTQGYQKARRNIQRAEQMGRKPNEVDLQIVKSYVPQTKGQMEADRIKAGIWAAGLVGGPVAGKGIGLAAKAVGKRILSKKAAAEATKKAAAKKAATNAKRRAARARAKAEKDKAKALNRQVEEGSGLHPSFDKIVKGAGNKAANKVTREEAKKQTAKRVAEQAKRIRRNQKLAVAGLTGAGITAAGLASLRGDTPPKKKSPKSKAAMPEPEARATENAAAEKKRRATAAAPKKKRRATAAAAKKKRHAEEFVGTGPRGAVAPKHILQDKPPKSKQEYNFFKGGLQKVTLPKLLGGREVEVDSRKEVFDYMDAPELNLKSGGRLKKKTKPRKRAALRGQRAELRGS